MTKEETEILFLKSKSENPGIKQSPKTPFSPDSPSQYKLMNLPADMSYPKLTTTNSNPTTAQRNKRSDWTMDMPEIKAKASPADYESSDVSFKQSLTFLG